jgi:rSAM/selenodomain-associated transferase 1
MSATPPDPAGTDDPLLDTGAGEPIACVFAKPPRPGQVKTRLALTLGAEPAARFAAAFLEDTCAALRALPLRVVLTTTEPWEGAAPAAQTWLQGEGGLGERLERALRRALVLAPWALAIGADSPGFPLEAVTYAERALRHVDVAIGPAADGGFYFVALRRCPEGCFADVPWSSSDTLVALEERMHAAGLSTTRMLPWFDVDTPADLARLEGLIDAGEISAPATARALALHGAVASRRALS